MPVSQHAGDNGGAGGGRGMRRFSTRRNRVRARAGRRPFSVCVFLAAGFAQMFTGAVAQSEPKAGARDASGKDALATVYIRHTGAPQTAGPRFSGYILALLDAEMVATKTVNIPATDQPVETLQNLGLLPPGLLDGRLLAALCSLNADQCKTGRKNECGQQGCWIAPSGETRKMRVLSINFFSEEVVRFRHLDTRLQNVLDVAYRDGGCRDAVGPYPEDKCRRTLERLNGVDTISVAQQEQSKFWLDIPATENTLEVRVNARAHQDAIDLANAIADGERTDWRKITVSQPLDLKPSAQAVGAAGPIGEQSNRRYLELMNYKDPGPIRGSVDVAVFDYFPIRFIASDASQSVVSTAYESCLLHDEVIQFPVPEPLGVPQEGGGSNSPQTGSKDDTLPPEFGGPKPKGGPKTDKSGTNPGQEDGHIDNETSGDPGADGSGARGGPRIAGSAAAKKPPCQLPRAAEKLDESHAGLESHHGPVMASIIQGQPRNDIPGNHRFGAASNTKLVLIPFAEDGQSTPELALRAYKEASGDDARTIDTINTLRGGNKIRVFNVSMEASTTTANGDYALWISGAGRNGLFVAAAGNSDSDGKFVGTMDDCNVFPACWSVIDVHHAANSEFSGVDASKAELRPSYRVLSVAGAKSIEKSASNYGKAFDVSAIGQAIGQSLSDGRHDSKWYGVSNSSPAAAYVSALAGELAAQLLKQLDSPANGEVLRLEGISNCSRSEGAFFKFYNKDEGYRIRNRIIATADYEKDTYKVTDAEDRPSTQYGMVNFDRALSFKTDRVRVRGVNGGKEFPVRVNYDGQWAINIRAGAKINNVQESLRKRHKDGEWATNTPLAGANSALIDLSRILRLEKMKVDGNGRPLYRIVFIDDQSGAAVHFVNARIRWFKDEVPIKGDSASIFQPNPSVPGLLGNVRNSTVLKSGVRLNDIEDLIPRWINYGCTVEFN